MAVRVNIDAAATMVSDYDKGQGVLLDDGHLVVIGRDRADVLAIFAPGGWHHADVT